MIETDPVNQDVSIVAKGASLSLVGKIIGRLLSFISDIILARVLGASVFGLYSIGWTLFRILQMVIPLGFPQGVIKFIPEYQENQNQGQIKGIILSAIAISLLSGVFFFVILFSLAPWMSENIFHKPELTQVFRLFSIIFPFCSLLSVTSAITRSSKRMKFTVLLEDIGQPLTVVIIILILISTINLSIQTAIFSETISFFITGIVGLVVVRSLFSTSFNKEIKPDITSIKKVLAFSIPTSLAGMFSIFVFWIDRLIVGSMLPSSDNGIYQVLSQLSMVFVILYAAFNAILGPIFADLYAKERMDRLEEIFRVGTKWNFYLGIIPFIIYLLNSSDILSFVFGPEYSLGWLCLIVLSVGQLVNCGTGSIGVLLLMSGNQRNWFWMTSSSLLINIIICLMLVPKLGIVGAAIGTSLSVGGMNIVATFFGKSKVGVWPYDRRYIKGVLAGITAAISGYLINSLHFPVLYSLILCCFVVISVFSIVLYFLGFDSEDIQFIEEVSKRVGIHIKLH